MFVSPVGDIPKISMHVKERALLNRLLETFPFTPTVEQVRLLKELARFTLFSDRFELFLLKGYAGTGKTTVISNLVNNLSSAGFSSVLLAPTGRAAKVISRYSNRPAHTIHRKIYFATRNPDGSVKLVLWRELVAQIGAGAHFWPIMTMMVVKTYILLTVF